MPKLVIVESPTKAKTLNGFLKGDFVIKASFGHIRDLPKSGLGVDVDHNFVPEYEVPVKAKKTLADLKSSAKDASGIILATDPDREGEAIAWHLKELLSGKKSKQTFERVVFHELTKEAIEESFSHTGEIDMNLVGAQQARRILDRLVGYKLSPLLWKKVRYGLSAGRVQSVAVRLVVEKERERTAFKPEEYWTVKAKFTDISGKRPIEAELTEKYEKKLEIKNAGAADNITNELKKDSFEIGSVEKTERKRHAYPPLKTSTLQQAMANTLGFSAKRTMSAAQKLFEKGYITYHRTDSLNLSEQFVGKARTFISDTFGENFMPDKTIFYKNSSKNAQEAHEAIRPTDLNRRPSTDTDLTSDEAKVYSVVWKRALECQMAAAVYDQTGITIVSAGGYRLKATGSVVKFEGWLAVGKLMRLDGDADEIIELADYSENEKLQLVTVLPEQHFTQPPARYSDATLIKKLEELGVGRPSTYAPTISTIQDRGYVTKDNRYFVPTDFAYVVTDLLVKHFPDIVDYQFTADMEESLDAIADGKKEWVPVIRDFYTPFEKVVAAKDKELKKTEVTNLGESDEKCPECGSALVYKLGKFGKFLSCSAYPECKYAKPLEELKALDDTGKEITDFGKCPKCDDGVFVLKQGRFGKFLACSNYPKCKTTQKFLEKIGVACPTCGKGDVIVKKAKGRTFYGCSNYPECKWSSWKNPKQAAGKETVTEVV